MVDTPQTPVSVVFCTAPPEKAHSIASELVNAGLAACVNVLPVRSVYRWDGQVVDDSEDLLIIKTTTDTVPELTKAILKVHPYEVPEIISLPVQDGFMGYLDWVAGAIHPGPDMEGK